MKKSGLFGFILAFMLALTAPAYASVHVLVDNQDVGDAESISVSSTYGTYAANKLTITAPAMANDEAIINTTDGTVEVNSDSTDSLIFKLLSKNTSNGTVAQQYVADNGADATDRWQHKNVADGTFTLSNDTSVAGTYVVKATYYSTGDVDFTGAINYAADTASNDTYLVPILGVSAYRTGMKIIFKAVTANTGACTVNVNSIGAKNLLVLNDVTPPDNYIEAGSMVEAIYDGTSFQIQTPDANP